MIGRVNGIDGIDGVRAGNSVWDSRRGFIPLWADGSHANGLERVPYDGYRAILHADEMVLPSKQADIFRKMVDWEALLVEGGRRSSAPANGEAGNALDQVAALIRELIDLTADGVSANQTELRQLKQHLAHVLARKAALPA